MIWPMDHWGVLIGFSCIGRARIIMMMDEKIGNDIGSLCSGVRRSGRDPISLIYGHQYY
jgi:sulfopyruvate decarboxylase TPP-binding subunit